MADHLIFRRPRQPAGQLIPPAFVYGLLEGAQRRGLAVDGYLHQAGIVPAALASGQGVAPGPFVALFHVLAEALHDESLGQFSRPFKPGSFALVTRLALAAPDLGTALRRIAQAFNLLQDDLQVSVASQGQDQGDSALCGLLLQGQSSVFLQDSLVRVLWRLAAWLVGGTLPVQRFDFQYAAPAQPALYEPVFPAARHYAQPAFGFWCAATLASAPVRRGEDELRRFLADAYAQIIAPPRASGVTTRRVRHLLWQTRPAWPGLPAVAQALHLSAATLQRRLAAEHTSLQWVKDELRRELALARLAGPRVPLAQIAAELGYSDAATFQRAFRQWTGQSCGAYRPLSGATAGAASGAKPAAASAATSADGPSAGSKLAR